MKIRNSAGMRRIAAVWCMICMMLVSGTGNHTAYAQDGAKVTASSRTDERGGTVEIALKLSGNPGIWGIKFRVSYDREALTLTSVTAGEVFAADEIVPQERPGQERYVFYAVNDRLENISADGTLAVLTFTVADDASFGDHPVSVEIVQAVSVDGEELRIGAADGKVTVQDPQASSTEDPSSTEEPSTGEPSTEEPSTQEPSTGGPSTGGPDASQRPDGDRDDIISAGDMVNGNVPAAVLSGILLIAGACGMAAAVHYGRGKGRWS